MKPIRFKRVEIRRPRTDPHPEKSTTNNTGWRKGMFIVFEDYEGNEYDYIPRWDEMVTINKAKKDIDDLNKDLYKENNK